MAIVPDKRQMDGIQKIEVPSLRERVYEELKSQILTNQLRPGQQIVIDQLSQQFGVSHTPLRESLAMLALDGLVTMTRHKNPQVTSLEEKDVIEVYEMRILIEGFAAREAARSLSDEKLEQMSNRLLKPSSEIAADHSLMDQDLDITLHAMIIEKVDNSLFKRVTELVTNHSTRVFSLVDAAGIDFGDAEWKEHTEIVEAIKARDPDLAQEKMEQHLRLAQQRSLSALREISSREEA